MILSRDEEEVLIGAAIVDPNNESWNAVIYNMYNMQGHQQLLIFSIVL